MKTSETIQFNENIQPACLPQSCSDECPDNAEVLVSGWGTTESGATSLPNTLRKAKVPIISRSTCSYLYNQYTITDRMTCTDYFYSGGISTCQGDSGGPMVCYRYGYFQVDGLTSWGVGCADAFQPGVYSRVCQVLDWIEYNLNF